jgi:hypothetical protein
MSTKSFTFGLFAGLPKITRETKALGPAGARSAIVLTRPSARSRAGIKLNLNRNTAALGLIVLTAGMLVAYIFGINQSAAKGYEVTREKNKLNLLAEENKKLLVRLAEVGSIVQIQEEAASNRLVQITNQEYLEVNQLSQR